MTEHVQVVAVVARTKRGGLNGWRGLIVEGKWSFSWEAEWRGLVVSRRVECECGRLVVGRRMGERGLLASESKRSALAEQA